MRSAEFSSDLIKFLKKIDSKVKSVDVDPKFRSGDFSLAIVLIGRRWKILRLGCAPYVNHIKRVASEGYRVIYVLAGGKLNCVVADETIAQILKETTVKKTDEYRDTIEHDGRTTETLCVRLENTLAQYDPCVGYFTKSY
jgi:hypothetical protein